MPGSTLEYGRFELREHTGAAVIQGTVRSASRTFAILLLFPYIFIGSYVSRIFAMSSTLAPKM
jgi:hypothetical protein